MLLGSSESSTENSLDIAYEFDLLVSEPDEKYKCPICLSILNRPVQTICGHRFCKKCIITWIEENNKCPVCNEAVSSKSLFPDNCIWREISNQIQVYCQYKKYGCNDIQYLGDFQKHVQSCQFAVIKCQTCGEKIQVIKTEEHEKEFCKKKINTSNSCQNCKVLGIQFLNLKDENKICSSTQVKCSFSDIGCKHICKADELIIHCTESKSIYMHQLLLKDFLFNMKKNYHPLDFSFYQSESASNSLVQSATRSSNANVEQELKTLHDICKMQQSDLNLLRNRECFGSFVWSIKPLDKLRNEAINGSCIALHSPSFYSSPYGYKMCLRTNLNGIDTSTGKYLTLFVHLMQGNYDSTLSWPFRGSITLTLVDLNATNLDITETLRSKSNIIAFQKPTSQRSHKGFGYMEFIELDMLNRFIKDNSLVFRVKVTEEPK